MSEQHVSRDPAPTASTANIWLVLIVVALSGVLVYQYWTRNSPATVANNYVPRQVTPRGDLAASEKSTIAIFEQTSPSVVFIRTRGFQQYLFGGSQEKELSSGTGLIWDRQGHIVTNLHVIEDTLRSNNTAMEVQFADNTIVDAELIGGVRENDIAIVKVDAAIDELIPVQLGTSDDLQVGQQVLAIGNPFGFDQTLSTGVIGGLNRTVAGNRGTTFLDGLIQTDAAINPGNSGGPLLDSAGRMIGINTAIVSPTGAYSGLGFAVPVSRVMASVDRVLNEVSSNTKPVLGISVLSTEQAQALGVPSEITDRGLFIKQIDPTGPAAGVRLDAAVQQGYRIYFGDQIASVDGKPVTTVEALESTLSQYRPGDTITLGIYRRNQRGEVQITLQARKLLF